MPLYVAGIFFSFEEKTLTVYSHLLGKKSWNVYNKDNIERVRRDEANAKVEEEAEEQRMQEVDAARRLAILRGEVPPPIEDEPAPQVDQGGQPAPLPGTSRSKRPRKQTGEDDTDYELRMAKQRDEVVQKAATEARRTSAAPIVDRRGHIDLFGDDKSRSHAKNEEAEKEANRKKREYEDQYTMRFSNAGGQPGLDKPWYSAQEGNEGGQQQVMKNVWGRDDPKRKERDEKRIVASDPLSMMKQGARKVRELKQERKQFREEREQELREMKRDDERGERRSRHSRRHRSRSPGSSDRGRRSRDRDDRHSRHRSRSPRPDEKRRHSRDRGCSRKGDDRHSRHHHRDRREDDRRHRHRSRSRERHRRREDEKRTN